MILRYKIEEDGYRVKSYLVEKKIPDQIFKDIRNGNGQYLVNDQTVDDYFEIFKNDILEVVLPSSIQGDNVMSVMGDLDIVYEDSYLIILNKPNNLATIPTKKYYGSSLANYVMSYYKRKGITSNIHFVSRLDAPTSGLIMLGKNSYITYLLQNTLITKRYLLETTSVVTPTEGIITGHIEKDPSSVIKRMLVDKAPNSKTVYKTIYVENGHSFIDALLCTGKTHQLRLHFSSIGAPIVGDELYGTKCSDGILHLHSYHVEFYHPITNDLISVTRYPSWIDKNKVQNDEK